MKEIDNGRKDNLEQENKTEDYSILTTKDSSDWLSRHSLRIQFIFQHKHPI